MSDEESDCTIEVSTEVLEKLRDGEINPMMAVMGGQIKISGDMGLAMKVQSLIG
jgi:putative sterol carrier protein